MAAATPSRADEIRLIWTENQWLYLVAGFMGGVLFCLLIQLSIQNLSELIISLLPEAVGILVTITLIDVLNRRRDERNAVKQLQEQLIRDASSIVNDVANNAVYQLRKRGWLEGDYGLLPRTNLKRANLQKAELQRANLREVDLLGAKLQEANLVTANLQEADLFDANLQNANLSGAKLDGASLMTAKLQGADLSGASLQRADLSSAKLQDTDLRQADLRETILWAAKLKGANLYHAILENADFGQALNIALFDETTILPDGTFWTPDTDLTKFTQPKTETPSE